MEVKKNYVETNTGQIHFRYAGDSAAPNICLFHASPGSSRQLNDLISGLAKNFFVYAPDTPGNGLSDPLPIKQPEIFDYASAHLQAMENLGIKKTILFGTHTGASIAACLSQISKNSCSLLVLDSVGLYDLEEKKRLLDSYAPKKKVSPTGDHLMWAWHFIRDQWLFWPWHEQNEKNRIARGLPELSYLHGMYIDVLENLDTYHLSYNAAFRFDKEVCFKGVSCQTIISSNKEDMLFKYFPKLKKYIPNCTEIIHEGWQSKKNAEVTTLQLTKLLKSLL